MSHYSSSTCQTRSQKKNAQTLPRRLRLPIIITLALLLFISVVPALSVGIWQNVGAADFSVGNVDYISLALDSSNAPYVAYMDRGNLDKATVMKFDGANWGSVGSVGFSAGSANDLSLVIHNDVPYLAYSDYSQSWKASVVKYTGTGAMGGWEFVGNSYFTDPWALHTSLALHNNTPYVAYIDMIIPQQDFRPRVMKYNSVSDTWERVGTAPYVAGLALYTSLAIDSSGTPYVAYQDLGNGGYGRATVKKFNGASWELVGSRGFPAGAYRTTYTSLALDSNDTPYVAFQDYGGSNKATVMKFNGTSWVSVGTAGFSAGNAEFTSLVIHNDIPYVAFQDVANSGKATVMRFNGTDWEMVGNAGFTTRNNVDVSLALDSNGIAYLASAPDAAPTYGPVSVMKYMPVPEIDVQRPVSTSIADGGTDAQGINKSGEQVTLTYTIENTGDASLNISNITSTSASNVSVNSISPINFAVASGGGTATFDVTYTPAPGDGAFSFELDISSDDADETNYDMTVSGTRDGTSPTVSISSIASDPTNTSPIPVTITFSESVTEFAVGDLTLGNGTASNFSGSGTTYTADIIPTADGTVTVDVAGAVAQDSAGNDNTVATQFSITYDTTAPDTAIDSQPSNPSNDTSPTFSFSSPDITATFECQLDGGGYSSCSSPESYTGLVAGSHTFDVRATDLAGNTDPTPATYTWEIDTTAPSTSISSTASDPTNTSPIPVTVTFSETMTGFDLADITVSNGSAGNFVDAGSGVYTVDISPTTDGAVTVDVAADIAQDSAGNNNTAATQFSITYDSAAPSVTIEQGSTQPDPTNTSPIILDVVFSENMTGFDNTDVDITGMAAAPTIIVTSTGAGDTYTVEVSGVADGETITAAIPANAAQDTAGNDNTASTSTDNSVTYDTTAITMLDGGVIGQPNDEIIQDLTVYYTQFTSIEITFSTDAANPAGDNDPDDVTNPDNFLLIQSGINEIYDTLSCLTYSNNGNTPLNDDIQIPIGAVTYNTATFTATVDINNGTPLPVGEYRLLICGTTSITDLAGNALNNGFDETTTFTIAPAPSNLPSTGFPHGRITALPKQPAVKAYTDTAMVLEIPKLGVSMPIVGVPQSEAGWDVTWLGNNVGYLAGSAFPTWAGNTVITAHVWDTYNRPGVFAEIKSLKHGDQVQIHAWGLTYTYVVRESRIISPKNINIALKHEEYDWVTLITCEDYNTDWGTYDYRRMVRAVLISIE